MLNGKTLYLARHAETVFNRAARLQGNKAHTPLTANGMRQALAMAQSLAKTLGKKPDIVFWCSPAGRTRQTAAAIADALGLDYFTIMFDERLREIDVGDWTGDLYSDVVAREGQIIDETRRFFIKRPPGGEWYDDMAGRLLAWAQEVKSRSHQTHLAISHGLASRVLRGGLTQREWHDDVKATIAPDVPQGSIVKLSDSGEHIITPEGAPASHGKGL